MPVEEKPVSVSPDSVVAVPEHIVYRAFAAETVVLNLQTGRYHGLNPTGGRMLATLDGVGRISAAAQELASQYDQSAEALEQDLCNFCDELLSRGLIELKGGD